MRAVSLFTGAGGMDLGFERAGFSAVLQCDLFDASHLTDEKVGGEKPEEKRRELTRYGQDVLGVLERHWPVTGRVNDVRSVRADRLLGGADHEPGEPQQPSTWGALADVVREWPGVGGVHDPRDGQDGAGRERDGRRRDGAHEGAGLTGEQLDDRGVDVLHFGSPCQDLSVAGRRDGFVEGGRSHLFFEGVRVARECSARVVVWENVVGALSSNGGRDFAAVLASLADSGAVDIAWRVLDARWFGVPQRRRRVFVVADFGGERAAEVLFEPEGSTRPDQASGASGEGVACALTASVRGTGDGHGNACNSNYVANALPASGRGYSRIGESRDQDPLVVTAPTLGVSHGVDGLAHALTVSAEHHGHSSPRGNGADNLVPMAIRTAQTGSNGWGVGVDEQSYTLDGSQGQAVLAGALGQSLGHHRGAPDLDGHGAYPVTPAGVRRLTPRECERLMGWPDDWTRWTADGREVSDSHRYRMCGNGVVAPVAEWIGRRIAAVLQESEAAG